MDNKEIMSFIDHTQLKPTADWSSIETLCKEAIHYGAASVCIPPCYISRVKAAFGDALVIGATIGFPLGYNATEIKVAETRQALQEGAGEVDFVINITDAKNGNFDAITAEIASLKAVCGDVVLKVIIETCYLTEEEKIALCHCVTKGGADYIKTSTGMGTAGATLADVSLMKAHIGSGVKIKAAGGIRTKEDILAFIQAGCSRIGSSGAVNALYGEKAASDAY